MIVLRVIVVGLCVKNFLANELFVLIETFLDNGLFDSWEIRIGLLCFVFRAGQEVGPDGEQWLDDNLNVAFLKDKGIAGGPVEKLSDIVSKLLLYVSLLVVFFHLECHPFEVHGATFARVAVVRGVHTHVHDQLLVLWRVLRKLLRVHSSFECADLLEMIRDVRGQYHFDHDSSDVPILCLTKQFKDVIIWIK